MAVRPVGRVPLGAGSIWRTSQTPVSVLGTTVDVAGWFPRDGPFVRGSDSPSVRDGRVPVNLEMFAITVAASARISRGRSRWMVPGMIRGQMWTIDLLSREARHLVAVRQLVREYLMLPDAWSSVGGLPEVLPPVFEHELAALPEPAMPPRGEIAVSVGDSGTGPFGVGLLIPFSSTEAEMKRLYVRPSWSGRGAGHALVKTLLEVAGSLGYEGVVLDVLAGREAARCLYEDVGFVETGPYRYYEFHEMRFYRYAL